MGLPNTVNQLFNGGSPYYIVNRSLRFRSSASAYLARTPSASSQTKFTFSAWVKRGGLGINAAIFDAYSDASNYCILKFSTSDTLLWYNQNAAVATLNLTTTQVLRDPSAWYHIVVNYDSAQATSTNRAAMYINGVQVTAFGTATYPSQNTTAWVNAAVAHDIGRYGGASNYFDGYLAEVNFIDGQALTPSSFGAFDTNGIWQPIRYAGTYGTNGFYLPFSNTTSTTTLVADASGNGNNWTPNNISLTAGTTYDSMLDSPTVSNASSNYAVMNPNFVTPSTTFSNGNLTLTKTGATDVVAASTMAMPSNKWYWEITLTSLSASTNLAIGIVKNTTTNGSWVSNLPAGVFFNSGSGVFRYGSNVTATLGTTFATNDVLGLALDMDAGTLALYKNNTLIYTVSSVDTTTPHYAFWDSYANGESAAFNFGQRPFTYTPPSGFNALNTANLPAATISYGAPYMNAVTYTGYGPLIPSGLGIPTKRNASTQNVSKSLRFRASASAYLNRTFSTPTNNKIWTWSGWAKRGSTGSRQFLSSTNTTGGSNAFYFEYDSSDAINIGDYGASWTWRLMTTQVFKDPTAWHHIVLSVDTTQATASNRVKLYVNGVEVTAFSTATYPSQNSNPYWNSATYSNIGNLNGTSLYFDGYLAQLNFIDGQQLTPSSFGETNSDGVWVPKSYTGTYGTNGFYLPFTNTTSTTTLVADSSGNGNNWTPNNISLTAGITYDSMIDSPTDYASAGNYCVLNPLDKNASSTLSNANLTSASGAAAWYGVRATIPITSGKWYWEVTSVTQSSGNAIVAGIADASATLTYPGVTSNGYGYYSNTTSGIKYNNNSGTAYGAAFVQGDVIGVAFDADGGTITFYVNGVSQGQAFSGITSGPYFPMVGNYNTTSAINFGQRPFSYTAPSGYSALNTYNITAPSKTWFSSANNSGRGSATAYPDFVWIKSRSSAQNHSLNDTLRGPTLNLLSNSTNAEAGASTMFNVNKYGLTLGNDASVNSSSYTDVMWGWQAGQGTTSTNTSGTITSTVSVSAQSGFSVVLYTGNSTIGATVGHGLGVAPNMIILKPRNAAGSWIVYHSSYGNTGGLVLNLTNAAQNQLGWWNNTSPSSTVFTLGGNPQANYGDTNYNYNYVAYCFAAVRGYSAFGSYTGNGSADGPFVFTNFRPRWLMVKAATTAASWVVFDTSRSVNNVTGLYLCPNLSQAEAGPGVIDIDVLSNGFKLRNNDGAMNTANTYIYAAFAENPFSIARAR